MTTRKRIVIIITSSKDGTLLVALVSLSVRLFVGKQDNFKNYEPYSCRQL